MQRSVHSQTDYYCYYKCLIRFTGRAIYCQGFIVHDFAFGVCALEAEDALSFLSFAVRVTISSSS